MMSRE